MSKKENLRLSAILIQWYNENKRDLPWRKTSDPYIIWISEVILQQTRVDQGYDYFNRFVEKFPTVALLAKAGESEVLKLWQGLGYYSRARNLHAAAKMIVDNFDGKFPRDYKDILSLKGVGEYTAAAIASFAFNEPYAVVDGNVYRVLSRIFAMDEPIDSGRGKKAFAELAQSLLDESKPGLHNQAIMEFGALQCVPVSPDCENCPALSICIANDRGQVSVYPVKEGKQKTKNRYFSYFDIHCGDNVFLHKRTAKDIWQNLYELPLVETKEELFTENIGQNNDAKALLATAENVRIKYVTQVKHVLSHQVIYATFYKVIVDRILLTDGYIKVKKEDVDRYPVSRLVHKYLELL
ncbi:A/G-specific adenine glycosylase [Dysgonomonas sp. PFB1-18]|uniref:A/G-specific adenine glycosylase n=1 Tax=unclassified Dysgonomonas TaxID=2630389 RepID=UPI0024747DF3|nr:MULTISPECIES: A/G-specific adenine glycosylase [unclassified Dysgonomonas]MDH6310856.1 A/G-specific adenine glycosylase [Dysgonomonas sp. PF1-14]MDH6340706.1 A/G-specific adenine glycosylase [Dysgonomonas sp. PF1-16]MDH6382326.1 A/G-specific adenine glycosylase [Dysgonomonas sp. PFB1-18]MDH6399676.1 A/G-specific adenine glycosylase [Dysgonomonas sp. PF1-23]